MTQEKKLTVVKEKYLSLGINQEHIDYAIEAVKAGEKRDFIFENLTSDYRNLPVADANFLIEDLYEAFGGEFKLENRKGYFWGAIWLVIGFGIYFMMPYLEKDPSFGPRGIGKFIYMAMYAGFIFGTLKILAAIFNAHREDD